MTCCDWSVKELHPCREFPAIGHWVSGPWPEWAMQMPLSVALQLCCDYEETGRSRVTFLLPNCAGCLYMSHMSSFQKPSLKTLHGFSEMIPVCHDTRFPRCSRAKKSFWGSCFGRIKSRSWGVRGSLVRMVTPCSNLASGVSTTMAWSGDKRPYEKFSLLLDVENIESNEFESWL